MNIWNTPILGDNNSKFSNFVWRPILFFLCTKLCQRLLSDVKNKKYHTHVYTCSKIKVLFIRLFWYYIVLFIRLFWYFDAWSPLAALWLWYLVLFFFFCSQHYKYVLVFFLYYYNLVLLQLLVNRFYTISTSDDWQQPMLQYKQTNNLSDYYRRHLKRRLTVVTHAHTQGILDVSFCKLGMNYRSLLR